MKHGDAVVGCGISKIWMLSNEHPWSKSGVCTEHDRLFDERKLSQAEVQKWWVENAWKASPTLKLKAFYLLTLPLVSLWTLARYKQSTATRPTE